MKNKIGSLALAVISGMVLSACGVSGGPSLLEGSSPKPYGIALDSSGNIFTSDMQRNVIYKITSDGTVSAFAGTADVSGSSDGTGTAASFNHPAGLAIDTSDNVYVADSGNHTIRKITSAGVVTTIAGTAGSSGSDDGTGTEAKFNAPLGLAVGANLYVADTGNNTIRKITSAGVVTTIAGTAGTTGSANGTGAAASFNRPSGITFNSTTNRSVATYLFVADTGNNTIRQITPHNNAVTTIAGQAGTAGSTDGATATFNAPLAVWVPHGAGGASFDDIYVTDTGNNTVRDVYIPVVRTFAWYTRTTAGTAGVTGSADGTGAAASFNAPSGITEDASGNLYIADSFNNAIRKVVISTKVVTTFASLPK